MAATRAATDEKQQFYLDLRCTGDSEQITSKLVNIELSGSLNSTTIGDLKQKIEEQHEIPKHLMKLQLNSAILADTQSLDELNLRNGDTFIVNYYSKADCRAINNCISILNCLLEQLQDWDNMKYHHNIANFVLAEMNLNSLGYRLFLPWLDVKKYANKLYFVSKDGLVLVNKSLSILLDLPQASLTLSLQRIEGLLLVVMWNITEDAHIRRAVVRAGGLDTCVKALLIKKVVPTEVLGYNGGHSTELIRKSLGVFANLSELPEIRLTIACNKMVMEQMYSIALNSSFQVNVIHSIVMIILVLGYTPTSHTHLILHPSFREFVTKTYTRPAGNEVVPKLIRYHLSLLCSLLLLRSPQYFTQEDKAMIKSNLRLFVASADPSDLSKSENTNTIVWDTLKPHVEAIYQTDDPALDDELRHVCKLTVLIALQTMIDREWHRTVLMKEGIVDFMVCLPWHQQEGGPLCSKAKDIVGVLRNYVPYQPPSLLNICKAAVAVYHCGLHDVMRLTVPELTSKVLV